LPEVKAEETDEDKEGEKSEGGIEVKNEEEGAQGTAKRQRR
jgi:hypothetical protein